MASDSLAAIGIEINSLANTKTQLEQQRDLIKAIDPGKLSVQVYGGPEAFFLSADGRHLSNALLRGYDVAIAGVDAELRKLGRKVAGVPDPCGENIAVDLSPITPRRNAS